VARDKRRIEIRKGWVGLIIVAAVIFLVAVKDLPSLQSSAARLIRRLGPATPPDRSELDSEHVAVLWLPTTLGKYVEVQDAKQLAPIIVDANSSPISKSLARLSRAIENHPGGSTEEVMRSVNRRVRTPGVTGCEIEWRDEAPVLLFRRLHGETLQQSIERCAEAVEKSGHPVK
jgi:hypothetical protein